MTYAEKVKGCFLGKCLGGGIGMAFEGTPYCPGMKEETIFMQDVPNDDMEMQLIWVKALEEYGLALDPEKMGEIWLKYIPHGCDEYSMAQRNLRRGIMPPASGWKDNFFVDGMGAAIRSEVWGAIFAGRPDAAMHFAEVDSCVDHWGNGVWGEIFMAAADCHAFMHGDRVAALRFALEQIPADCRLGSTFHWIFSLYDGGIDAETARTMIKEKTYSPNFTDCVMNLSFVLYALLWGEGDFIKSVLMAVNMGRDTDCTAATAGAFLGILGAIPEKWAAMVKDTLIVSPFIYDVPDVILSLDKLVEKIVELHEKYGNPPEKYGKYVPYVSTGKEPSLDRQSYLVIPETAENRELVARLHNGEAVAETEKAPFRVVFDNLIMDLSPWAKNGNSIHLFSELSVTDPPEDAVLSMTADTGCVLWIDGKRTLSHHSRLACLPSFHRAEGGAAFLWQVPKKTVPVHIQLYSCTPPLRCCLMFGNIYYDHLEGFKISI